MSHHPAEQYALDVYEGKVVVGKLVKLAVERFFKDLQRQETKDFPYYHDPQDAEDFITFCSWCRHFEGRMAGKPFELEPWQQFIAWNIFGWKKVANGKRRFTTAYIEVAKKNGKSLFSSAVQLFTLSPYDREASPQVYAVATTRDQARIVFNGATAMVEGSPMLRDKYELRVSSIYCPATRGFFKALASDAKKQDGWNVHSASMDEYHEHPSDAMYGNLESAMSARDQPLMFVITTAGFNTASSCYRLRETVEKIVKGRLTDESTFGIIFSLDKEDLKGDNWQNPKLWVKANPTMNKSITQEKLLELFTKAKNEGSTKLANFKTKNVNIWLNAYEEWEAAQEWHKCNKGPIDLVALKNKQCYGGLDLASNTDLTALTLAFPKQDGVPLTTKLYFFWLPEDRVKEMQEKHRVDYQRWVELGYIKTTRGNIIDKEYIRKDLQALAALYDIVNIHYDPWNLRNEAAVWAEEDGLKLIELPPTLTYLATPTKDYETQIFGGLFNHGDHPVMNWMISQVQIYRDPNGNIRIMKKEARRKVDGPMSDVMATFGMHEYKEESPKPGIIYIDID